MQSRFDGADCSRSLGYKPQRVTGKRHSKNINGISMGSEAADGRI